jgi:hypothetical protein
MGNANYWRPLMGRDEFPRIFEHASPYRFRSGETLEIQMIRATVLVNDPGRLTPSRHAGDSILCNYLLPAIISISGTNGGR